MESVTAKEVVEKWLDESATPYEKTEVLTKFIVNNLLYIKCIYDEKREGYYLKGLSLSKMRKFYEQVSKLRAFVQNYQGDNENLWKEFESIIMKLDVIIAYEMGRNSGEKAYAKLRELINEAYQQISDIENVNKREKVQIFIELMESLIAYHRLADTEGERIIESYKNKESIDCEKVKNAYQKQVFPFKIEES